ncbi:MAG: hypothetical protein ACK6EB_24850, partial [Planctomyces sp.]
KTTPSFVSIRGSKKHPSIRGHRFSPCRKSSPAEPKISESIHHLPGCRAFRSSAGVVAATTLDFF